MEFIAVLERAESRQGSTPSSIAHLEKIFRESVGDNNEIDLNNFKKIVQSKNMFFVERMFRIFDADNSGSVSLEEFMRIMRSFSQQSPAEKLHYLFQVYDLNDDNTIQFSELRNVISECMKENGLVFSEDEIDELTRMLFEDADTDGSGSITFNEFKEQLQRHPAFLENLSLSIERWLLPPLGPPSMPPLLKRSWPDKLKWSYIRNNWASVTFLFIYLSINLGLFVSRAIEYCEHNGYVIVARACGQCLNFTCAFILVLVLRQSLTWLRTHGLAKYLPIDQHLYYHKVTGWFILVYSLLHTMMHIGNFAVIQTEDRPLHLLLISTNYGIGWVGGSACLTGWILLAVLLVIVISALPCVRRSGKFEVFYCLHFLSLVFWTCLILHGPNFWKWFMVPGVFFIIESIIRISRNLASSKKAYVQQGVLLPSKVTHLVIKRPPKFDFRPGDYVYINIPSIAQYEWHPFTISSAPELDDVIWLHVRGVGEWTNRLYTFFDEKDKEAVLCDELAKNMSVVSLGDVSSSASSPNTSTPLSNQTKMATLQKHHPVVGKSFSEAYAYTNSVYDTFIISSPKGENGSQPQVTIQITEDISENSVDDQNSATSIANDSGDLASNKNPIKDNLRTTSLGSTSSSMAIQKRNKEDVKRILAEQRTERDKPVTVWSPNRKEKRKSVRVSVASRGLRRCQTVIVMPTVNEDDDDEENVDVFPETEEDIKDLRIKTEAENVVVAQQPLKIYLDGPYGSPTRHIFQARHAVLIATGIGVTPFASILQSIMCRYRKSRHTCPKCNHRWTDPFPVSNVHLRKVDFFWLNRHQRSFEWFVSLLSELEIEQAQLQEKDRFLDIHMYITSALDRTDMKAVGLQMALDLLYQKENRCLITGLKSRTQPGRPNWNKVFGEIASQKKGKVTVFFCGPQQLAKTLHKKCNEFRFEFRKEIF